MKRSLKAIGVLGLALLFSGCATPVKNTLTKDAASLPLAGKSVVLITISSKNAYKPDYPTAPYVLHIEKPNASSKKDRFNFLCDDDCKRFAETGGRFLFRAELEPGEYVLQGVTGHAGSGFMRGMYTAPFHMPFTVQAASISYGGNLNMTLRERVGEEYRAGSGIPILQQNATGMYGGTFDVVVEDLHDTDIGPMRSALPALATADIRRTPLPPYDRASAEAWWKKATEPNP